MPLLPSEEVMKKRLSIVNCTQESVQTSSKWVLHHRDSIDKVANCWLEIYKTANDKLRTALIYTLNDVVQKAAAKRDINITFTFHPHLINAITISSPGVKKAISRCVEVFEQRNVYPPHIIEEIKTALITRIQTEKTEEVQNTGEIDFPTLIRGIESFYKNELLTDKAREILSRTTFNFKDSVQARVKDRNEGIKALTDIDTSRQKLVTFLDSVQKHQKSGLKVMEMMKQAEVALNLQLRDVTVVNDAYEKFAEGIRETKEQLEAMDASGVLLNESPPRDAPSPTANDDPFLHGVDGEELAGGGDDMEMDEDDKPGTSSHCFLKPSKDYVASIPARIPGGDMDPRIQRTSQYPGPTSYVPHPQQSNGPGRAATIMDPRQARFFSQQPPPMVPPEQIPFPPPMNMNFPPPGLSPPQQQQPGPPGATAEEMKQLVDTSQPPPKFFNMPPPIIPRNGSMGTAETELNPPLVFNPNNPPPPFPNQSMMSSPPPSIFNQQLSPPPNFNIPPPGLVHPPTLFSQHQPPPNHYSDHGPGLIGGHKRRNTAESDGYYPKRGRNDGGRNGGGNWKGGPKQGNWRRSFGGGEAGQYRH